MDEDTQTRFGLTLHKTLCANGDCRRRIYLESEKHVRIILALIDAAVEPRTVVLVYCSKRCSNEASYEAKRHTLLKKKIKRDTFEPYFL